MKCFRSLTFVCFSRRSTNPSSFETQSHERYPRDPVHHEFANRCLDDFLSSKEDAKWIDGVERLPQERRAVVVENIGNGGAGGNPIGTQATDRGQGMGGSPGGAVGGTSASGPRLGKLRGLGCEGVDDDERDEGEEDEDFFDDIGRHNEYLRERKV